MLIERLITAIIFGILVITGMFYLSISGFILLASLLVGIAVWEFSGFFWQQNYVKRIGYLLIFLTLTAVALIFPAQPTLIVGGVFWLIVPYFLWRYTVDQSNCLTHGFWQGFVGMLIFVPCLIGLIEIQEKFGASFLLYLLLIICAADIGAYFTGRFWGKHLLASKISPKKTLEGVLGGLLFSLLVTVVIAWLLIFNLIDMHGVVFDFKGRRGISLLILVIITCLWSVIGDLFESMLKRQVGIKDSGKLLPGHGGMYDRIDSLTAAIPIFVLGFLLI